MESNNKISVVIPVYNAEAFLDQCLSAVTSSDCAPYEVIVVDDSSTDHSVEIAEKYTHKIIHLVGGPHGPAFARNRGVDQACGDIVLFVDCDVVLHQDTICEVLESFELHPEIVATFGSYDNQPSEGEFLSQYKNLVHHFVHQQAHEMGGTFWAGCGAIRREVFLEFNGFDESRYSEPSIEDIELGYRLTNEGKKVFVNKAIQVKHLKKWTLGGWIKTDIFSRAVPWTQLILEAGSLPDDLNLENNQKWSAGLVMLLVLSLVMTFDRTVLALFILMWFLCLLVLSGCDLKSGERFLKLPPSPELIILLNYICLFVAAYFLGVVEFLAPLSWLLVLTLIGRFLPFSGRKYKQILFSLIVFGFVIGFNLLLVKSSIWLAPVFFLLLVLILALNQRLFAFFFKNRGVVFALAAIPFQLTYYLYSTVAFVYVGMVHYLNKKQDEADLA